MRQRRILIVAVLLGAAQATILSGEPVDDAWDIGFAISGDGVFFSSECRHTTNIYGSVNGSVATITRWGPGGWSVEVDHPPAPHPIDEEQWTCASRIAVDAAGDVYVAGSYADRGSSGINLKQFVVAKYRGTTGRQLWKVGAVGSPAGNLALSSFGDVGFATTAGVYRYDPAGGLVCSTTE